MSRLNIIFPIQFKLLIFLVKTMVPMTSIKRTLLYASVSKYLNCKEYDQEIPQ